MNLLPSLPVIVSSFAGLLIGYTAWWFRWRLSLIPRPMLHNLFDTSNHAVYVLDRTLRFHYINPRAHSSSRIDLRNSIGKRPPDVIPPEILGSTMQYLQRALAGELAEEKLSPARIKDQALVWRKVTYSPVRNMRGAVIGVLVTAFALDEIYEIARIAEREATLLDSMHEAVILTDLDRHITAWNRGAQELFGYTAEEASGKHAASLVTPDLAPDAALAIFEALQKDRSWDGTVIGRNKAGTRLDIELKINRIDDLKGSPSGYIAIHHDVTERNKVQRALQDDEAMLRGFFKATTIFTGIIELLPGDLRLVMCNQRLADLYGFSIEE